MSYRKKGLAQYHPEIFWPVVHWKLASNLNASFGTRPLVVEAGTERYTDLVPGLRGFFFDGSTNIWRSSPLRPRDIRSTCARSVSCALAPRFLSS